MSNTGPNDRSLALMKRALHEIRELRGKVDAYERAAQEPIAIVGIGCRFAGGVSNPESLWQLLLDGRDTITELPASRDRLMRIEGVRPRGSFLDDVDRFDAPFFDISAREAASMDPQQRLLLEVSWEALEHAGIRPSALRGSRTGVYVGVMTSEYAELLRDGSSMDLHSATGGAPSVIAGRLSHFYGLHGPALIVDTACSSSLAAVHLACQSLRKRDCDHAFAAGLNLLLSARAFEAERRAGMLAADGRCKTFDASADGIGRGEGVGVVVLRRLSDALRDGNSIVAVIRGSAMNHDGRSSGLTTPNERAQEQVLRDALADARVSPADVDFIEAHGTGTSLGDPVEVGALASVFGPDRVAPLLLGAAKANFGHLEGAAGILGLIKAALVVKHGEVPPQLHLQQPNPLIPWSAIPIAVPTARRSLSMTDRARVAGVSAFGLSGTNVHVVVEQSPAVANPIPADRDRRAHLLAFSAKTPAALDRLESRLRARVRHVPADRLGDFCRSVRQGRDQFEHRRAIVVGPGAGEAESAQLRNAADRYASGEVLDWDQIDGATHYERIDAPTYPFEDHRYWVDVSTKVESASLTLTRRPVAIAGEDRSVFECVIDPQSFLADHRVDDTIIVPAAAFIDLGLQAARAVGNGLSIRDVALVRPLAIDPLAGPVTLQLVTARTEDGTSWQVYRLDDDQWTLHVEGRLGEDAPASSHELTTIQAQHRDAVDVERFYDRGREHGLDYGPSFRSIAGLWRGSNSALARIAVPGHARTQLADPAALDGCLQMVGALSTNDSELLLPASIEVFALARPLPNAFWCLAKTREQRVVDLELIDDNGVALATATGVAFKPALANQSRVPLRSLQWIPIAPPPQSRSLTGSWVIFRSSEAEGDALAARLRAEGAHCALVICDGGFEHLGNDVYTIDPACEDDYARVLDAVPGPLRGVVHLWNTAAPDVRMDAVHREDALVAGTASALHLARALVSRRPVQGFTYCIVSRGAQSVSASDAVDPWQAPVWGMTRTMFLEHPELGCKLVDLDPDGDERSVDQLCAELSATDREEQVAHRGQQRCGLRLAEIGGWHDEPAISGAGAYVITGGVGALGLHVADWLIARGARHLTLVSRSAPGSEALKSIEVLRAAGANVHVASGDVASLDDVVRIVAEATRDGVPLKGLVHAAGVLDDHAMTRMTWESCRRVFAPKILGAWNLHTATEDIALDFFVCFSSAAALLGSPGQANYAAANEWLNAFAQHRRGRGLPGLSINWGPWAGTGMAAESAVGRHVTPLSTSRALNALEQALAVDAAVVAVLPMTTRFDADIAAAKTAPRLLAELARPRRSSSTSPSATTTHDLRSRIAAAHANERRQLIADATLRIAGKVLGRSLLSPDADVSLARLGMDSLLALEIRDGMRELGVDLSAVDILSAESISALVTKADERLGPATAAAESSLVTTWPASHGQRSLWFLHGLDPSSCAYHVAFVARVRGALDPRVLEESFNVLSLRHPVLNSRFVLDDGALKCHLRPDRRVRFETIDARGDDEASLMARVRRAYERPFDLAGDDAPFRVVLVARAPDDHVLLTVAHHIVHDAWSVWLLADELRHVYPALLRRESSQLAPATRAFGDVVIEQLARIAGPDGARDVAFWRDELSDLPTLDLPTDHPRPVRRTTRGATASFALSPSMTSALRQLAAREGATLFTVLLAAFDALLHRYSAQDDVIVGVPMSGRDMPGVDRTVGYFVNTMPIRSRITTATTFRQLVDQARRGSLAAMAHQAVPLSLLVDELRIPHDPSRSPLFQALFVFQQPHGTLSSAEAASLGDARLEPFALAQQEGQFDLTLELTDLGERITGAWKYSLDLFEDATAGRMLAHLQNLLEAIIETPEARVQDLRLLGKAERELAVVEWNRTDRPYDLDTTLTRLFEAQVARTPDATALIFEDTSLSYRELDARASQLARALVERGVSSGDVVGVCADRSLELVIALYAIGKAGAAYCPLDPSYPDERLDYMMATAGVRLVLPQQRFAAQLIGRGIDAIVLDGAESQRWRESDTAVPLPLAHPDDVAYVIYTSGSTGRPKGVMVSHRAIINRLLWMQDEYRLTAADRILQKTTFSFDVSVWEFFWPLLNGAALVIAKPDGHRDPAYLARLIRERGVTVMHFVPSMLTAFLDEPTVEQCASLRHVVCSGEALPAAVVDRFHARNGAALHNLYGPTEAAVDVTYWACDRHRAAAMIPIGYPIANTRMHVLDRDGQAVPIGVAGELMIGGVGLARGYSRRPGLTADRFVPDSLQVSAGARLYRTGDRARYLPDGAIEYLGRLDHQVKLRGQRIELGEIESAIGTHPSVRASAVMLAGSGTPHARLVAHIECHEGSVVPAEDALRSYLSQRLPEAMVPSRVVVHAALPLTASGKIDRKRLPEPAITRASQGATLARTPGEQVLSTIWSELLRVERVGIDDNFFALGGDSILGMQMVMRAVQAGLNLTVAQFYENQTIASLALAAGAADATATAPSSLPTMTVRPTPIQSWFFDRRLRTPHHFNQSVMFEVSSRIDTALLEQALRHLVAHHESLRTLYSSTGNIEIAARGDAQFAHVDLTAIAANERRARLEADAAAKQRSLDPARGAVMRVTLYTFGNGEPGRLHFIAHHLAVDGVSWRILLDDLRVVYRQLQQGQPVRLADTPTSYQQWSERLYRHAESDAARSELAFWLRQAQDELPLFAEAVEKSEQAEPHVVSLDVASTALLDEAHDAYRTRTEDLLVTALMQGLAEVTGRRSARIDLESHGRSAPFTGVDVTRTVGWFTALYPVRLDLGSRADDGAEIKAIKETLRSVPNHGIGFGVLRYLGSPATNAQLSDAPSQVRFNFLGRLDQGLAGDFLLGFAREHGGPLHGADEQPAYAIEVDAYILEGRLFMRWSHDASRITADAAHALADRVLNRVRALVGHCCLPSSRGLTPSDVPAARLDQGQLDRFLAALESKGIAGSHVADIYELSPVQEGMLYHTLAAENGSIYNQRLSITLQGELRAADFRAAWQSACARHAALRTAFFWDEAGKPLQVVLTSVALPWVEEDWRHKTAEQQRLDLAARNEAESRRGFDLGRAPLMQFELIRLADDVARFSWSHHHILLDGWSFAQILDEVTATYASGRVRPQPPAAQYRSYVEWLQARPVADGQRFWRGLLEGFTSPTELGIESPVLAQEVEAAHRDVSIELDAALTETLTRAARDCHSTIGVFVQAAWAMLLQRYSGTDDVVFGVTVAGRPATLRGSDQAVGLFINTLPARVQVSQKRRVRDVVGDLLTQQGRREDYTSSSLAEIQVAAGLPAGTALFRSVVVIENYPLNVAADSMPGLELRDFSFAEQTNYPLTLSVFPGARLQLKLAYDAQRFSPDGAAAMLRHLRSLLAGMSGDAVIGDLSLLDADERRRVTAELPQGRVLQFPSHSVAAQNTAATIHDTFEAWVARTPDAPAISFVDRDGRPEAISYRELDRRGNRLSNRLRAIGVQRGDRVGVLMERTPSLIVSLLAILKSGAAYVPCDPAYPDARIQFMLDDTRAVVTLCDSTLASKLPSPSHSLNVDELDLSLESDASPSVELGGADPAYVIYTSGSTGKPKGVVVSHDNVVRLFEQTEGWFDFRPDDVWTFFHSVAFDFSVWEIWGAFAHGARVAIVPFEVSRSTDAFRQLVIDEHVTVLSQTPSAFSQLMIVDQASPLAALPLRYVVFGGEALDIRKLAPWFERHGDQRPQLVNMYGITETTVHVTYRPLIAEDRLRAESVVGVPIPDLTLYVLDREGEPAPIGVPGEIFVGGAGLALGYLNRPSLTAERFVPDAFGSSPGARLYRTGDRARFMHNGDAEHLGRIDAQVKLRGFRIELGEIEAALRASAGVVDAAATLADLPAGPGLVGYVVARANASLDVDALRASLFGRLPDYMIPSIVIPLDQLPRTSNGKLDRRALPAPATKTRRADAVVPRTEAEHRVLEIWRDVLQVDAIGIHDNFFDLGGHSLLLVRVHSRLKAAFGREFPIVTLFAHPTIHSLAGFLAGSGGEDEADSVVRDRSNERTARERSRSEQRAARGRARRQPEVAAE